MSSSHVPLMLSRQVLTRTDFIRIFCQSVRSLSPLSRDAVSSRSVPFAVTLSSIHLLRARCSRRHLHPCRRSSSRAHRPPSDRPAPSTWARGAGFSSHAAGLRRARCSRVALLREAMGGTPMRQTISVGPQLRALRHQAPCPRPPERLQQLHRRPRQRRRGAEPPAPSG